MKTGKRGADLAVPAWGASSAGAQLALQGFGQLAIVDYESDRVLGATGDSYGHSLQVFRPGQRVQDSFSSSLQDMVLDSGQHLDPLPLFLGRFTATTGDLLTLIAQAPEAAGSVVLEAMPAAEPPQTAESVLARLRRSSSRIAAAPDRKTLLAQAA